MLSNVSVLKKYDILKLLSNESENLATSKCKCCMKWRPRYIWCFSGIRVANTLPLFKSKLKAVKNLYLRSFGNFQELVKKDIEL